MADVPPVPWPRAALFGAAGAVLYGLCEVIDVVANGRLGPDALSVGVLVALAVVANGVAGALIGSVGALRPLHRAPVLAAALGFTLPVAVRVFVAWASDPPPQVQGLPLQGNAVAAGLLALLPLAIGGGWALVAARRPVIAWGVLGALIPGVLLARHPLPRTVAASPHPNLLLVTLDTARWDRFDARAPAGGVRVDTAAFERIAREGTRYDRAYAEIPVTGPSHLTILSGSSPWEHGVLLNGRPVPRDRELLAERLHAEGYDTAAFVSAYVLQGDLGFSRGFDVYDDDFRWFTGLGHTAPGALIELLIRHRDGDAYLLERRGDATVDRALTWLASRDETRPFFLWVHLFDPHGAYVPPPPFDQRYYRGSDPHDPQNRSMDAVRDLPPYLAPSLAGVTDVQWVTAQYDGEIAYADQQMGRLLDALDAAGQREQTVIVAVGDHGEGLGEEGEWFAHGDHLYEHDLHVPLAIRSPSVGPAWVPAPASEVTSPVALSGLKGELLQRLGLGGAPFPTGRARAVCLDREANRAARLADPHARPALREASITSERERVGLREAAPDDVRYWVDGVATPFSTLDPEATRWRTQLQRDAAGVLTAPADAGASDDATRALLERLGYIEP